MFRNDLTAGSVFADVFVTPGNGVNFQWRASANGQCVSSGVGGVVAPVWLKLTRSGTNFLGYYGYDGLHWTLVGSNGLSMASSVRVGLALTAHNNSALGFAAYDGVAMGVPTVPSGLTAFGGDGWIDLAWTGSLGAVNYGVKRAASLAVDATRLDKYPPADETWSITRPVPGRGFGGGKTTWSGGSI